MTDHPWLLAMWAVIATCWLIVAVLWLRYIHRLGDISRHGGNAASRSEPIRSNRGT